jgi:ABC-type proline/glycine betaine transport system substrate-binding protein
MWTKNCMVKSWDHSCQQVYRTKKKKKSLQDHTKINSYGEKNNAQVPMSIWHHISTWQGLKSKKCFMV